MESFEHQFFCNNEMSKKKLKKMRKNYYYIPEKYNFGKFMGAEDGGEEGGWAASFPILIRVYYLPYSDKFWRGENLAQLAQNGKNCQLKSAPNLIIFSLHQIKSMAKKLFF